MHVEIKPHIGIGIGSRQEVDTGLDGVWIDGRRVALAPRTAGADLIINSDRPLSEAVIKEIKKKLDQRDGLTPDEGVTDRNILQPPRLEDDSE